MKTPTIFSNNYVKGSLFLIGGLFLGWLLFHHPAANEKMTETGLHEHSETEKTSWTCAMHPQIKMEKPGMCPICGMDLIPLQKSNAEIDADAVEMSESAMKLAQVQTYRVSKADAGRKVALYGKIQPDEKLLQRQTAHFPGRIEKLFINVTGETIKEGQLVARVYSPELVTAQKELLEALALKEKYPAIPEAARQKLLNWKLTAQQVHEIESSGTVKTTFDIYANTSGIVTRRNAEAGDYINMGDLLFEVSDLSRVWAVFDAYESDLPWIKSGQDVEFTGQSFPGKTFKGKISFIDPVINPATRTARVRAEIGNPGLLLKPGLFVNGTVSSENESREIIIPQSAVLWTGSRSVVYVKLEGTEVTAFKMRMITLGASLDNAYVVKDGLKEGEEIAANGTFTIDAAAQLEGKPSMMNISSETGSEMPETEIQEEKESAKISRHETFHAGGNCEMCKERIESAAKSVKGVTSAEWDAGTSMISVRFESRVNPLDIRKAIASAGHDTDSVKADDKTYASLPDCCHYRK